MTEYIKSDTFFIASDMVIEAKKCRWGETRWCYVKLLNHKPIKIACSNIVDSDFVEDLKALQKYNGYLYWGDIVPTIKTI